MNGNSDDICTSLTVVQNYPAGGETWMIYDCRNAITMTDGLSTIYETLPPDYQSILSDELGSKSSPRDKTRRAPPPR